MAARSRQVAILASISVVAVLGTAIWGWSLYPLKIARWAFMASVLPICWGYVELMQVRGDDPAIMSLHRTVIAWTGLILLLRVAPRLAVVSGLLDPSSAEAFTRLSGLSVGVGLMVFGNYLPKFPSPWQIRTEPFDWQRVHRFCGWVFLAGGTAMTAAWSLLPLARAREVAPAIFLGIAVLAVGRKFISLATHGRRSSTSEA